MKTVKTSEAQWLVEKTDAGFEKVVLSTGWREAMEGEVSLLSLSKSEWVEAGSR